VLEFTYAALPIGFALALAAGAFTAVYRVLRQQG